MSSINFLKGKKREKVRELQIKWLIQVVSVVVLGAFLLVVTASYTRLALLRRTNDSLTRENKNLEKKIDQAKDLEILQTLVKSEVMAIKDVRDRLIDPSEDIRPVKESIKDNVLAKDISLDDEGSYDFSITADSSIGYMTFLEQLKNIYDHYREISLDRATVNEEGVVAGKMTVAK